MNCHRANGSVDVREYNLTMNTAANYQYITDIPTPEDGGVFAEGGVEVTLRKRGKTSKMSCKKLIASDGLQSRIVKNLGQNRDRAFFGKGPVIEYEITNVDNDLDRGDLVVFGKKNLGRQGGLFVIPSPREKKAYRFETMSLFPGSNAYKMIEFFIKESPFAHWFKKAKIVDKSGAIVELFTPIKVPYQDNIIFVGDAAAFGECLYQGATMRGYMAAQAVDKEPNQPFNLPPIPIGNRHAHRQIRLTGVAGQQHLEGR